MKKVIFSLVLTGFLFGSCSKNKEVSANKQEFEALFQRVHGEYTLISSNADQDLDVNMDGVSSSNMISEFTNLNLNKSEIRVLYDEQMSSYEAYFNHKWPDQVLKKNGTIVSAEELSVYTPSVEVLYVSHMVGYQIVFQTANILSLVNNSSIPGGEENFTKPDEVAFDNSGVLSVTIKKRMYTKEGSKLVTIVNKYQRTSNSL